MSKPDASAKRGGSARETTGYTAIAHRRRGRFRVAKKPARKQVGRAGTAKKEPSMRISNRMKPPQLTASGARLDPTFHFHPTDPTVIPIRSAVRMPFGMSIDSTPGLNRGRARQGHGSGTPQTSLVNVFAGPPMKVGVRNRRGKPGGIRNAPGRQANGRGYGPATGLLRRPPESVTVIL